MGKKYFNVIDIAIIFISLITFILDVSTDILVCAQLLLDGESIWGWLMVTLIAVPAVLMSSFSLAWHVHDKTVTPLVLISHLFLLAPVHRYIKVICSGINSFRTRKASLTQCAFREQSDASILRLFEAFLECAPQLVLQLYIMLNGRIVGWITAISAVCSLISLSWAMTVYSDSHRRAHSAFYRHRIVRLLFHWLWQLCMTAARVAAFAFFARTFHQWVFAMMGVHWLIAFVCISVRGTDFGKGCWEKWSFRLCCAFIYIFVFLNLNDGASRWRVSAYYVLVLLENTAMVVVFLVLGDFAEMIIIACLVVFAGFFLGVLFMMLYYAFLHPSGVNNHLKRFLHPNTRDFSSTSFGGTGPQIFSIESPRPMTILEETVIDMSHAVGPQNANTSGQQALPDNQLSVTVHHPDKNSRLSQMVLQKAWQSGMVSSSGSSSTSSLVSIDDSFDGPKRTPSVKSVHSHNSASSEHNLLPPAQKKTDTNKDFKASLKYEGGSLQALKNDPANIGKSDSDFNSICPPRSPTQSRSSWMRSSDFLRQSIVLEDFTVLGFDDSSSTDQRNSDSSSFHSHPKNMSPLNVSNLWKDVHSHLRATIAATIAAATGNASSSNEGTPRKSHSTSSWNSGILSGPEDSLNSIHNADSVTHNTAFIDSGASYKEKETSKHGTSSLNALRKDTIISLPDILEALDQDQSSNLSNVSFEKASMTSAAAQLPLGLSDLENDHTPVADSSKSHKDISRPSFTSQPEDSTLTASKLGIKETTSYLKLLNNDFRTNQFITTDSPRDPSQSIDNNLTEKGNSPFTDQELASVMAQSLQSYAGGSSSIDSNNLEREGLALTMEDLRISRETSPEQSPFSNRLSADGKSRSASSLFHDSSESSPASSASKMNHLMSVKKCESDLSPNAFKLLELSPQMLDKLGQDYPHVQAVAGEPAVIIPRSLALKFIMDSYGQGSPSSHKSFQNSSNHSSTSNKLAQTPSNTHKKEFYKPQICNESRTHSTEIGAKKHTAYDSKKDFPIHRLMTNGDTLGVSLLKSPRSSLQIHETPNKIKLRASVSSTKKLNVCFSDVPSVESPWQHKADSSYIDSDSGSEQSGYVAGQYCPPLYGSRNPEVSVLQKNPEHRMRHSNSLDISHDTLSEGVRPKFKQRKFDIKDKTCPQNLRIPHVTTNSRFETPGDSDMFSINHSRQVPRSVKLLSNNSQPSLQYNPPTYRSNDPCKPRGREERPRSYGHPHSVDTLTDDELQQSAQHVAEYFNEALETTSLNQGYHLKPKKHHSQPQLLIHGHRQPLQRLDNSPKFSVELSSPSYSEKCSSVFLEVSSSPKLAPESNLSFSSWQRRQQQPGKSSRTTAEIGSPTKRNSKKSVHFGAPDLPLSPEESPRLAKLSLSQEELRSCSRDPVKQKLMFESHPCPDKLERVRSRPPVQKSDRSLSKGAHQSKQPRTPTKQYRPER